MTTTIKLQKFDMSVLTLCPNILIICDDLYDNNAVLKNEIIKNTNCNKTSQLFNVTNVTIRESLKIPVVTRITFEYVFIFRGQSSENLRELYYKYCGIFPTFQIFKKVFYRCTENDSCMVIYNGINTNKLTDCVFWYKV